MAKEHLLILFGGQSSEHDVSCMSAMNVIRSVDRDRYDLLLVGITREGRWVYVDNLYALENGSWEKSPVTAVLSPDATKKCVYVMDALRTREFPVDVAFPVLHGLYGEDGTIQGIFELARIPYVGSGVLSSAVAMDKVYTKIIVSSLGGIRQAKSIWFRREELEKPEAVYRKVEKALSYPVFVKPSQSGSSVGVTKAIDRPTLEIAIREAARHDYKIIVEEAVQGRELECAVFGGNNRVVTSGVGEIVAAADFYDYDAKYNNPASLTDTDPKLPEGVEDRIRKIAERIFRAIDGFSLARVDFFLDKDGIVFNEINTMPGFTAISMYPMLFDRIGVTREQLVQDLIDTAGFRAAHEY